MVDNYMGDGDDYRGCEFKARETTMKYLRAP